MQGINNIVTQLEDMYKYFNKALEADLPENVVFALIPNSGKSRYLGWFYQSRWAHGQERLHEINIAADHLNRTVDAIAETVIHEMTHLKNYILQRPDCTRTQYHNKVFKKQAELFGLKVSKMRNRGYALTALDEKAQAIVDKYKSEVLKGANPFIIHRVSEVRIPKISTKKQVGLDKDLCQQIQDISGDKLRVAIESAMQDWIIMHTACTGTNG
jgi:hypothetical protein